MAHNLQDRYAQMVLKKLRAELVTRDNLVFNTIYEGDPKAGAVKIPVRDLEVGVRDYDKSKGLDLAESSTTYLDLPINKDKAINELIDGYDAAAVPDGIIAERLDSAAYSIALNLDKESLALLETSGTDMADTTASTKENIMSAVIDARTQLGKANVPVNGRYLIVSPEIMGLLLLSEEFIKAGDLSQKIVEQGVVGRIGGFNVFESNNLADTTEFIAGHPDWSHRVMEWKVDPKVVSLDQDSKFIGASAIKGRLVYGLKVSRPETIAVKTVAGE